MDDRVAILAVWREALAKSGGQEGHPGTTMLSLVENPQRVLVHSPKECEGCDGSGADVI